MDLIGAYSIHLSRADLLKRARRWLSEGRQARFKIQKLVCGRSRRQSCHGGLLIAWVRMLCVILSRRGGLAPSRGELVERYEVSESSLKRLFKASLENSRVME